MGVELDIINSVLAGVGESAVTSAESLHPSCVAAKAVLRRVDKAIQGRGWYFNTELAQILQPNAAKEILVPEGTLSIQATDEGVDVVQRGRVLYDIQNKTTEFESAVSVRRIARVQFDYLPPQAAEYIRAKAVYEFFLEEDGEGTKTQALAQAVAEAYMYLKSEHIKWQKTNSLRSPRALRVMFTRSASRGRRF